MTHPAGPQSPPAATPRDELTPTVEELLLCLDADINSAYLQYSDRVACNTLLTLALLDLKRLRSALSVSGTAPEPTPREPEHEVVGRFTAIDIKPIESPGEVRITFNVPEAIYREHGKMRLSGVAQISFLSARAVAPAGSQP